jgi:uncharacterized membrane protein
MRLLPVLLLRLALLVALSASAALVVDYANAGDPAFCGVTSGCFAVRTSGYAYLFGTIQLPYVGLVAYSTLFGFAFVAKNRVTYGSLAGMATLGGLFAAYLLYLQHSVIGAMCPWCVAVDTSAIVAAGASLWTLWIAMKDEALVQMPKAPSVPPAWLGAALVGIVAPFVWGRFPTEPPMSPVIQKEQVPGKLTIVAFTDFECPFCRRLHPVLHKVLEQHDGKIHFTRKMMPLSGHPGAEPAALAYLCTPEPLREAVADKLYAATPDKLTPEGAIILAAEAGADAGVVAECTKSAETKAKLDADKKLFDELGGRGLPFTFVGKRVVMGANAEGLESAVTRELAGEHFSLPIWAMFALIGAAFVGALGLTVREEAKERAA